MIYNFDYYLLEMEIKFSKFLIGEKLHINTLKKKVINKRFVIYFNYANKQFNKKLMFGM